MTILFNSRNHFEVIFSITGTVWKDVLPFCLVNSIVSITLYILNELDVTDFEFDSSAHRIMGIMVAFLVVSRVNAAYNRFWEARTYVGAALADLRALSAMAASFTNQDVSENAIKWRTVLCDRLIKMIEATKFVVMDSNLTIELLHNTTKSRPEKAENYVFDKASPIKKSKKAQMIRPMGDMVQEHLVAANPMSVIPFLHGIITLHSDMLQEPLIIHKEMALHQLALSYLFNYQELAKFSAAPYPFPIAQMTRIFLCVWMFTLPFSMTTFDPFSTTITIFFITFGFFGLEFVSIELDDPFGLDPNDISLEQLSTQVVRGIQRDLLKRKNTPIKSPTLLQSCSFENIEKEVTKAISTQTTRSRAQSEDSFSSFALVA